MNDIFLRKPSYRSLATPTISQRVLPLLIPVIIFIVALLPRLANLDSFITADEDDQIMFSSLFLKSALTGDLSNALVLGYPGVPTLILGATGVGLRYAAHYSGLSPLPWVTADLMTTLRETTLERGVFAHPLDFIVWVRAPMALLAALCIVAIYLLIRRLLGEPLALFSTLIIAFDPFILAHTRVIHVDAPLAYFMFVAFLAFLLYIIHGRWKFLIISGLFAGLAALSKTGPSAFLGPIMAVGGLAYVLLYPLAKGQTRWMLTRRLMFALGGCGLIGGAAFFALWPSMWSQPFFVINWIVRNLQSVNRSAHPTTGVFWGGGMTDQSPYYYFFVLPFHLTPLTTVGVLLALSMIIWSGINLLRKMTLRPWVAEKLPLVIALVFYVILFVGPISMVSRRGDRYILPVFFATSLLAALGLWWFATWLIRQILRLRIARFYLTKKNSTPGRLLGGVILAQITAILMYHPYYLAYFNPLLGGGQMAQHYLNIGWGEGLDTAARHLNDITKGRPEQVASWYSSQFSPYYQGRTVDLSDINAALYSPYTVFYINQAQRGFPSQEILEYFHQRQPLDVVKIGGVEYAWIYGGPILSSEPTNSYMFPVGTILGGAANLLGVDVNQQTFAADAFVGQAKVSESKSPPVFSDHAPGLPITLHWQTISKVPGEHNVYIRLLDEDGHVWGKVDRLILAGLWRPDRWRPGFVIRDEYRLPIDPATPPGKYHLEVGLYDFVTGQTYGIAKNIGQITLTPAKTQPNVNDVNVPHRLMTAINQPLTLVGHNYNDVTLTPGAEMNGKIFWQANQPLDRDYQVQFWLQAPKGQAVRTLKNVSATTQKDDRYIVYESGLSKNYPTSQWAKHTVIGAAYRFRASAYAPPGQYPLMVRLLDPTNGEAIGPDVQLAIITVEAVERNYVLPENVTPVAATLNNEIELVGFKLDNASVSTANEKFGITLYWRSLTPAAANYTVFIHAVGPDKLMRGQWDSLPVQGTSATSGWLPGEIIADHHTVPMEKHAPAWKYDLFVGMYDAATVQRLPIYSAASPISDNRIWLTQIQVLEK